MAKTHDVLLGFSNSNANEAPAANSLLIFIATLSFLEMNLQPHSTHPHAAKIPGFYFRLQLVLHIFSNSTCKE